MSHNDVKSSQPPTKKTFLGGYFSQMWVGGVADSQTWCNPSKPPKSVGVLADLPKNTVFFCWGLPLQIKAEEYCCNLSLCYLDSETNSTDRFQVTGQGLTFLDRSTFCPGLALASITSLNISNNCLSSLPPLNCLTSLERCRLQFDPLHQCWGG